MNEKIKVTLIIILLVGAGIAIGFYIWQNRSSSHPASFQYFEEENTEEAKIEKIYLSYLESGKNCDIDKAMSIITEQSKEIVHFTCSNMANEGRCYYDRDYEVRAKDNAGVVYLTPYSHKIENPLFFTKENGAWKLDMYKMWGGLFMAGSTCDSGWGWRDPNLKEEFCSHFEEGECPDEI